MMLLSSAMLIAATLFASQLAAPAAPLPRFSDLPNVTVTYYDVTGTRASEVHQSIERQRGHSRGKVVPAISNWSMEASVKTSTTGNQCKITEAKAEFRGEALMPRLVLPADKLIQPDLVPRWQVYVAQLEARQAIQLRFPYERLGDVEKAILAGSCSGWKTAMNKAIEKVRRDKADYQASIELPMPKLERSSAEAEEETQKVPVGR